MAKVYVCAILLAGLGVGLAAVDRKVRPVDSVESRGKVETPAPAPLPPDHRGATPHPGNTPEPGPQPAPAGDPQVKPPEQQPKQPDAAPPAPTGAAKVIPNLEVATLPAKLDLNQAYTLFTQGATFIDGRKPDEYAAQHVENATNLRNDDVQQNTQTWQDFFQIANQDAVHVVYCYGKDCHEADQLRETLKAVGFKQVFVMTASIEEWQAAGGPVAK